MPYRCRECRKRDLAKFEKHKAKLVEYMWTLDSDRLGYWAGVVMLDPRFCGATGQGGFGAVASECVNQAAAQILRRKRRMELVVSSRIG